MGKTDFLSRRADHNAGVEDNKDIVLLNPEFFEIRAARQGHVLINAEEMPILSNIRKCKQYEEAIAKAIEELKRSPMKRLRDEEWAMEQDLLLFRGKVYVPNSVELRQRIVKLHHDSLVGGHPGRWKTIELVTRNYWWPGLTKFVMNYVKGCDQCNRTKIFPTAPVGKLMPNPIAEELWKHVAADLIVELPDSGGNDSILVVCCRHSKQAHFIPCTGELNSLGLATLYRDHIWKLHGLPDTIISDRGSQFTSKMMQGLNQLLGIKTKLSTAYHPETDGQTERINQELEQYLRIFVNHRQDDWKDWLSLAKFSYNNRVHSATHQTPFFVNTGQHPRMGFEPIRRSKVEAAEKFAERMKEIHKETASTLRKAADDMKRYADQQQGNAPKFKEGDLVWLDASDIKQNRPARKLSDKQLGPYSITKIINPNAYELKLPRSFRIHNRFNVSKLRRYYPPAIPNQKAVPPLPIEVEGEKEYDVEEVIDSRMYRNKLQYLIKWEGYTVENNTWEPPENLKNAKKAVDAYHQRHPNAPRPIRANIFASINFRPIVNHTDPIITSKVLEASKHVPLGLLSKKHMQMKLPEITKPPPALLLPVKTQIYTGG